MLSKIGHCGVEHCLSMLMIMWLTKSCLASQQGISPHSISLGKNRILWSTVSTDYAQKMISHRKSGTIFTEVLESDYYAILYPGVKCFYQKHEKGLEKMVQRSGVLAVLAEDPDSAPSSYTAANNHL